MEEFDYPLAVGGRWYVTEVGGRSDSIKKDSIGLHAGALRTKTDLSAGDKVLIDRIGNRSTDDSLPRPLFARTIYHVKAITDFHDSRLLAMSSDGEAVLSTDSLIGVELGEEIILNGAVNRLPKDWIVRIVRKHLREADFIE